MKYLIDTNIIINHLRGIKSISDDLYSKGLAVSVITYIELVYGAYNSSSPHKNLKAVSEFFEKLNIAIIDLNTDIANEYGKTKVLLKKTGKMIDEFDILIGSVAKVYNYCLLTNNAKHFSRIVNLKMKEY